MTIEEVKLNANRMVQNIEQDRSPFFGMKVVTAEDIMKLWPQYATDMTNMFKDCASLEDVQFPMVIR
ncbi:MAG: hypothetical protein J7J70_02215 [Deltaproteobacteria bacterium]|nr:hypothetical protein [Candidatus Tharpellaceae bacterium]